MGVDDRAAAVRLGGDAREIRLGAGIGSVRGELHRDSAVLLPVPGRVGRDVPGEQAVADRGVEAPLAPRRRRSQVWFMANRRMSGGQRTDLASGADEAYRGRGD